MISLKTLNNLENLFPNKIIRYFSIDYDSIKNLVEFNKTMSENTLGYIGTRDKRNISHCIFIFQSPEKIDNFTTHLNKFGIDYVNNKYTYRNKTFLNDLFNEYNYSTNINI
jgi:hypothetical protein